MPGSRDIILDDGEQERHEFGLEAELGGPRVAFAVSAAEFVGMGWVVNKLGPQAIIYPGCAASRAFNRPRRRLTFPDSNDPANQHDTQLSAVDQKEGSQILTL